MDSDQVDTIDGFRRSVLKEVLDLEKPLVVTAEKLEVCRFPLVAARIELLRRKIAGEYGRCVVDDERGG